MVISSLCGLLVLFCLFLSREGSGLFPGIYLFLVYVLSSYIYFHIFNMSETARRIKILTLVYCRSVGKEEIAASYNERAMILLRLQRLLGLGILELRGQRYFLKSKPAGWTAKFILSLRSVILNASNVKEYI